MKRITTMFLAFTLWVSCAGCAFTPAPERDLGKMLQYLSQGKITQAEGYVLEGTLNVNNKNTNAKKMYSYMFSSISYTISGSETSGDSAQVSVSVTMIDMEALMVSASLETLESAFSGIWGEKAKLHKIMVEKMESGDVSYETYTVTAYMVKENGRWKVSMAKSASFTLSISGGASELIGY